MKVKNFKFGESVRTLASEAGMQPYRFTKQDEEKENRWKIYKSILERYAKFCYEDLISGKYPEILEYLKNRKIFKEQIKFFNIGYASQKNNFYNEL